MNQYVKNISKYEYQTIVWNRNLFYQETRTTMLRKYKVPLCLCVTCCFFFFKTLPQYLTLNHNIVLRMRRLQQPINI